MFEILPIGHGCKLFLKANGTLTHSGYQDFITPKVEELKKKMPESGLNNLKVKNCF